MKNLTDLLAGRRFQDSERDESSEPAALYQLNTDLSESKLYRELRICEHCRFHYSLGPDRRSGARWDAGRSKESDRSLISIDPLSFRRQRVPSPLFSEQRRTGLADAVVVGPATIAGRPLVLAAIDFRFMGGSVGCAAGEKLARAILEAGARRGQPVWSSWQAWRPHAGGRLLALMQFAKVAGGHANLSAPGSR